jgi:hypothetical protein
MRKTALVLALLLAGIAGRAGDALAQPGMTEPLSARPGGPAGEGAREAIDPAAPAGAPTESRPILSETTALWLSLGGTIASWAMVAAASRFDGDDGAPLGWAGILGTYLAPTLGHWYAGSALSRGLGIRTVGLATMFVGLVKSLNGCIDDFDGGGSCNDENGPLILLGGLAIYVGGTIDDIFHAPGKVRKRNARIQGLGLAPLAAPHTTGLALGGRF